MVDVAAGATLAVAAVTGVLAIATFVLALYTRQMVSEARDARELAQLPVLSCELDTRDDRRNQFLVRNVGNSPALGARIEVAPIGMPNQLGTLAPLAANH